MRASDEKREQIVNQFLLDNFFKRYDSTATLVNDVGRQTKGVDAIFHKLNVDIKAQTNYINNPTDTYCLEISTLNRNGEPINGWFLNPEVITDYYTFAWVTDADVNDKGNLLKVNKAEVIFIKKENLRRFIKLYASDEVLLNTAEQMRSTGTQRKALSGCAGVHYTMSDQLIEKPVVLVIPKSVLHSLSVKHCIVGVGSLQDVGKNVTN